MKLYIYKMGSFFLFLLGMLIFVWGCFMIYFNFKILLDWEILTFNGSMVVITLLFDWISLVFMSCVFFISSMVIYYSYSYMQDNFNIVRFYFLVVMFVISMAMMIISPNLISILIGWDGLGLVSYCLVIFFQNYKSYSAGMLTILTNRLGDVAILLSVAWMLNFGSWCFIYYEFYLNLMGFNLLILIILAGFTKSAQLPFSSWLPAAMAAPTPVSSLVHSSTLVTSGVYLLIRFFNVFASFDLKIFLLLSVLTMFMSGIGANFEFDLKKVIALSTLSQLGLMMSILFMGFPMMTYFHMLNHAFFKALLFLCAGLIIHSLMDVQDVRFMGCMSMQLPFTSACFCISSLSMCGVPFLSGFYSSDLIMELMMVSSFNFLIYFLFIISLGLTVMYSFRLIYYCFSFNMNVRVCQSYTENGIMMKSMIMLSFLSILSGSLLSWLMFDIPYFVMASMYDKVVILFVVFFGSFMGYVFNFFGLIDLFLGFDFFSFFGSMWFMTLLSTWIPGWFVFYASKNYSFNMDGGWGEFIVSKSSGLFVIYLSKYMNYYHFNNLSIFMFIFFIVFFMLII